MQSSGGECTSLLEAILCRVESEFLLIVIVIVRITLNLIGRQMPLMPAKQLCVHHSKTCQTLNDGHTVV
jgi:hypothetical protein